MKLSRRRRRQIFSLVILVLSVAVAYSSQSGPIGSLPLAIPETSVIPAVSSEQPESTGMVATATDAVLSAQPGLATVTQAVDGDTITVKLGSQTETVRFIGIDTPETHDPRKPVQCFGEIASARTKELLEGKSVRLEADPTNSNRDKYNRLLRYVYLPDGTLVNAQLINDGYAFAYTVFPFIRLDEFRQLESGARQAGRGLWSGCNVDDAKDIKQTTTAK